jgi:hypothetical protein
MTERELTRAAARRLTIIRHAQEMTGNVAGTCRYNGIQPAVVLQVAPPGTRSWGSKGSVTGPIVLTSAPTPQAPKWWAGSC